MSRVAGGTSKCNICLAIVLFLSPKAASAIQVPPGLETCEPLSACLSLLDKVVPERDDGDGSNGDVLARSLRRFGEPAKQELLRRAVGSNPGWRNVAGAILANWGAWTVDDVPSLRAALRMDHGGWVARSLGQIGSPDAIRTLVEDLSDANDFENQTGFALSKLGARAIPYLMPLLENDKESWLAARVIGEMKPLPVSYAVAWAGKALDSTRPLKERIAALRGIAALGPAAEHVGKGLHPLLEDSESEVQKEVVMTLKAVRDPIVVESLAKACQPQASQFDFLALDSALCLREIAHFGPGGRAAGEFLMPFLMSKNGAERAYGILTLSYIDYSPAVAKIEEALDSRDWRVVYAAVWGVGWLGDQNAADKLTKLASNYWLSELRDDAAHVTANLRSPKGRVERRPWNVMDHGIQSDPTDVITEGFRGPARSCPGYTWTWKGENFKLAPGREAEAHSLSFGNRGDLVGTDHGEWGGELTWIPKQATPIVLERDNVRRMDYDNDGAIVIFGLAHLGFNYGYALRLNRNSDGTWTSTEIARLPGEPLAWTRLKSDRIAVMTAGRVVVFSSKEGILGIAPCASK